MDLREFRYSIRLAARHEWRGPGAGQPKTKRATDEHGGPRDDLRFCKNRPRAAPREPGQDYAARFPQSAFGPRALNENRVLTSGAFGAENLYWVTDGTYSQARSSTNFWDGG